MYANAVEIKPDYRFIPSTSLYACFSILIWLRSSFRFDKRFHQALATGWNTYPLYNCSNVRLNHIFEYIYFIYNFVFIYEDVLKYFILLAAALHKRPFHHYATYHYNYI